MTPPIKATEATITAMIAMRPPNFFLAGAEVFASSVATSAALFFSLIRQYYGQ